MASAAASVIGFFMSDRCLMKRSAMAVEATWLRMPKALAPTTSFFFFLSVYGSDSDMVGFRCSVSLAFATRAALYFNALAAPPSAPLCELTTRFAATFWNISRPVLLKMPSASSSKYRPTTPHILVQLRPHRAMRCSFFSSFGRLFPPRFHCAISNSMYAPTSAASKSIVFPRKSETHSGMKGVSLKPAPKENIPDTDICYRDRRKRGACWVR